MRIMMINMMVWVVIIMSKIMIIFIIVLKIISSITLVPAYCKCAISEHCTVVQCVHCGQTLNRYGKYPSLDLNHTWKHNLTQESNHFYVTSRRSISDIIIIIFLNQRKWDGIHFQFLSFQTLTQNMIFLSLKQILHKRGGCFNVSYGSKSSRTRFQKK